MWKEAVVTYFKLQ